MHRFHVPTHTWYTVEAPPIATAGATLSHYRMANIRDYILLCGDCSESDDGKVHMFDIARGEWTSYTPAGVNPLQTLGQFSTYKNRNGHCALTFDPQHPRVIVTGGVIRGSHATPSAETIVLDYSNVAPAVRVDTPPPRVAGFEAFFDDEKFSDICMRVQSEPEPERTVHLHRVVLAAANERFRAMLSHAWGDCSEGALNVDLEGRVSSDTFYTMLRYLYTGRVSSGNGDPVNWLDLLILADEYLDDHLKQLCEVHLKEYVDNGFVGTVLQYARRYNAEQLAVYCAYRQFYHQ